MNRLEDGLRQIHRVALNGDDGAIPDALGRTDAIESVARALLADDPVDGEMPCGHPSTAVVQAGEGTAYCARCEEENAMVVYSAGEKAWDDAIHISNPNEPQLSLCGSKGRNLVLLDGPRPGPWSGCWSCLSRADALTKESS